MKKFLVTLLALVMLASNAFALEIAAPGTLPLVDEPVQLTMMIQKHAMVTDYNDNYLTKLIKEVTGVELVIETLPADGGEAKQKVSLMIAGGQKLPDILVLGFNDAELLDYGAGGYFLPMNDWLENDAYYWNLAMDTYCTPEEKELVLKYATSADGNIYGYPSYYSDPGDNSALGMWINKNWCEKLGLAIPTTTEELYNVLVAFRDQDPNGNGKKDEIPLMSCTNMSGQLLRNLMNPFIYTQDNYVMNVDGKLEFVAIQDGWKEGLAYIKKLVDEGLLSTLSFTQDNAQMTALMATEETTVGGIARNSASNLPASDIRREQYYIVGALEGPSGLRQHTQTACVPNPSAFISTNCKDVEAAVRVLDYLSSVEMNNWSRYGIEGENWAVLEEPGIGIYESIGFKGDIEEIKNIWGSEQNTHWAQLGPVVGDGSTITYRTAYVPKEGNYNHSLPIGASIKRELDYANTQNRVAGMIFTAEEQEVINEFRSTIEDAVKEAYTLFVVGERDLEKEWDAYVKSLYDMGLEPYMAAMQSCWDRTLGK